MSQTLDCLLEAAKTDLEADMEKLQGELAKLQGKADNRRQVYRDYVDSTLLQYGKRRCPTCDGTGALERMDFHVMRMFHLREWDGCTACGSQKIDERGKGYIDSP